MASEALEEPHGGCVEASHTVEAVGEEGCPGAAGEESLRPSEAAGSESERAVDC